MYYSEARTSPQTQESLVNFRHYEITMPKKMEAIGAIYSWDGSTAQTSDATAPAENVGRRSDAKRLRLPNKLLPAGKARKQTMPTVNWRNSDEQRTT